MVIRKKKGFYDKFDTESKLPVNLELEIWDNDAISADDFLGRYHTKNPIVKRMKNKKS